MFTERPIAAGEVVVAWGGDVVHQGRFDELDDHSRTHSLQIDDELYLVAPADGEDADDVNHSCDPTCGMFGATMLVARRDISAGEEITFDYAMTDSTDYDEFPCACGSMLCRGIVSGADWRRPELWDRYADAFSPYLQRRIDSLRSRRSDEPVSVHPGAGG